MVKNDLQSSVVTFSLLRTETAFSLDLRINKLFTSRDTFQFSHPSPCTPVVSLPSDSPFPPLIHPSLLLCFFSQGPEVHPKGPSSSVAQ